MNRRTNGFPPAPEQKVLSFFREKPSHSENLLGKEDLMRSARWDCIQNPNMDSSKRIFDQEKAEIMSIPVLNTLTGEIHLSKTDEVLFSNKGKISRKLRLTVRYSASIILPSGDVRKYFATAKNKDAAIDEISEYVSAIENVMGKRCVWRLEQGKVFYVGKERVGLSQLKSLKVRCKTIGKKVMDYFFDPIQG